MNWLQHPARRGKRPAITRRNRQDNRVPQFKIPGDRHPAWRVGRIVGDTETGRARPDGHLRLWSRRQFALLVPQHARLCLARRVDVQLDLYIRRASHANRLAECDEGSAVREKLVACLGNESEVHLQNMSDSYVYTSEMTLNQ